MALVQAFDDRRSGLAREQENAARTTAPALPENREFTTIAATPKFPDDFPENREWFREFAKFHPSGFVVAVGAGTR